jgi:hypothetical protein
MTIKSVPLHANGHQVLGRHGDGTVTVLVTEQNIPVLITHVFSCAGCGQYMVPRTEHDSAHIDTPCTQTDGITVTTRLNVPSGKLIVSTDLRPVYDGYGNEATDPAYDSTLGLARTVERFAAQGCAFGFVGDNWPDLYRTGENTYVLASPAYDEDADEPLAPKGWEKLADVTGAVWSYSLADYEDWKARGGRDNDLEEFEVVDVPAGIYEFVYHGAEDGFDRHSFETVVFTHIRKID